MYYCAVPTATASKEKHCIGAATSLNITGPYTPQNTPITCPPVGGGCGAVGPDGFVQGNDRYVVFKNGSAFDPDHISHVALLKVAADGYTTIGNFEEMLHSL